MKALTKFVIHMMKKRSRPVSTTVAMLSLPIPVVILVVVVVEVVVEVVVLVRVVTVAAVAMWGAWSETEVVAPGQS